jgi:hypothetical protein
MFVHRPPLNPGATYEDNFTQQKDRFELGTKVIFKKTEQLKIYAYSYI